MVSNHFYFRSKLPPLEDLTHLCSVGAYFFNGWLTQLTFSIGKVVIGRGEKRQTPFSSASFVQIFHTASVFWKQLIIIHKCVESIHSFNFSKSKKRKFEIQRTLVLWNIGIFWVFFGFLDVFTELHVLLGSWTTTENPLVRDEVTGDDSAVEVTESWKVSSQRKASWKNNLLGLAANLGKLGEAGCFFQASKNPVV